MISKIFIYIGGCHLAGCNCSYNRCRSRYAVTACKYSVKLRKLGIRLREEGSSPLYLNAALYKALALYTLTYGNDNKICRYTMLRGLRYIRLRTSGIGIYLSDYLRLCYKSHSPAAVISFYPDGSLKRKHLCALGNCSFNLLLLGSHIDLSSAVYYRNACRSKSDGTARYIHCNIAASDNHNTFALKVRQLIVTNSTQKLYCRNNALAFLSFYAHLAVILCAYRQIQAVIFLFKLIKAYVSADLNIAVHLYTQ